MYQIRTIGDKVLTQKSKRVSNVDDCVRNLCAKMCDMMYANNGIGLAAPQIGSLKRIIVIDQKGIPLVMINPEILHFSENVIEMEEGCLSIPGKFETISRPETIKVKYKNLKGKPNIKIFDNLSARIIQHEVDHLDGILMIEK